jgi:hypothetical protein
MTILLVGPDTSGWTLANPGILLSAGQDAAWFSSGSFLYTAAASATVTEGYMNVASWSTATAAHLYLYDGSNNFVGGTNTNSGAGFSSAGGTGVNLVATGFTPFAVTSGSTYVMVFQSNSGSGWRPNGKTGSPTKTLLLKHVASWPFGSPPGTLPAQDTSIGGIIELATWFQGTTGAPPLPLFYSQRKVLYFI